MRGLDFFGYLAVFLGLELLYSFADIRKGILWGLLPCMVACEYVVIVCVEHGNTASETNLSVNQT